MSQEKIKFSQALLKHNVTQSIGTTKVDSAAMSVLDGKDDIVAQMRGRSAEFGKTSEGHYYALVRPPYTSKGLTTDIVYFPIKNLESGRQLRWDHWKMSNLFLSDHTLGISPAVHGMPWWVFFETYGIVIYAFYVDKFVPQLTDSGKVIKPHFLFDPAKVKAIDDFSSKTDVKAFTEKYRILKPEQKDRRGEILRILNDEYADIDVIKAKYLDLPNKTLNERGASWIRGSLTFVPYFEEDDKKRVPELFA